MSSYSRKKLKEKLCGFINDGPHTLKEDGSYATYDELIDFLITPEIRPLVIQTIIENDLKDFPVIELVNGDDVNKYLVDELYEFLARWPGSIFPGAMPGIANYILKGFKKGPE